MNSRAFILSLIGHLIIIFGIIFFPVRTLMNDVPGTNNPSSLDEIALWVKAKDLVERSPLTSNNNNGMQIHQKAGSKGDLQPKSNTSGASLSPGEEVGQSNAGSGQMGNPVLLKILRKIESRKFYPASARHSGLEGKPKVRFQTASDGNIERVEIMKSSNIALLDEAAIETIKRSAPLPYYPKPIILVINYSLGD